MAPADGPPPEHLSYLRAAAKDAKSYGVFALLRGVESRARNLPRIGRSKTPDQNLVDLTQEPTLLFPASTLEAIEDEGRRRPEVRGYWLGLTGPMGPLPLHLTQIAVSERRHAPKRPFSRFLDLLAGRFLQLFYRAWADATATAQADRPDDDAFARYLGHLTGADEGVDPRSPFPARARLFYASAYASRRSAVAIQDSLAHLLRTPVRLEEFRPRWRTIDPADRTRIGRAFCTLGEGAVLGGEVRSVSDAFRVTVRAQTLREYEDFLPTGRRFMMAAEALDALTPSHLEWDLTLELEEKQARPTRLDGASRLGWTSWVAPKKWSDVRGDAHLGRGAQRIARAHWVSSGR